jgi:hypothetical protein
VVLERDDTAAACPCKIRDVYTMCTLQGGVPTHSDSPPCNMVCIVQEGTYSVVVEGVPGALSLAHWSDTAYICTVYTGRRFQSESTLQDIEIRHNMPDLDV